MKIDKGIERVVLNIGGDSSGVNSKTGWCNGYGNGISGMGDG